MLSASGPWHNVLEHAMQPQFTAEYIERFWTRVEKSEGCWFWTGAVTKAGYGHMRVGNGTYYAHRIAWTLINGPIPETLIVCHDCDKEYENGDIAYRQCCRPEHLFLGTSADNVHDAQRKRRRPIKSSLYTDPSFGVRLRQLRVASGASVRKAACAVGIDFSSLSRIENGHIGAPSTETITRLVRFIAAPPGTLDELILLGGKVPGNT